MHHNIYKKYKPTFYNWFTNSNKLKILIYKYYILHYIYIKLILQ